MSWITCSYDNFYSFHRFLPYLYTACFRVEVRDFSQGLGNTYQVYVGMFAYPLSCKSWSTVILKKCSRFCITFISEYSSRTKIDRDLEFVRRERKLYLGYHKMVNFYTCSLGKQAVDKIMWKICTKTFNFHHFCWIIQKLVFITHRLNWCFW